MEKTVLNSVRVVLTGAAVLISMTATTAHAANGLKAKYENLGCKEYLNSSQSSDSLTSKCVSLGARIDAIETRISKIYGRKNQFPSGVTLLLLLIVSLWGDGTKKVAGRR